MRNRYKLLKKSIERNMFMLTALIGKKKVKSMQRSGTEAFRTQIQPSKSKRKKLLLRKVRIQREQMVNRVSSYYRKGGHSATKTKLKII